MKFKLSYSSYWSLLWTSLLSPFEFPSKIIDSSSSWSAIFFFIINAFIGFFVNSVRSAILVRSLGIFFLGIGQNLFYLPLFLGLLMLTSLLVFVICRTVGGSGTLLKTFRALAFCSSTLILLPIPFLNLVGLLLFLILLIKNIRHVHQLSLIGALCSIIIPFLILLLVKVILF